MDVEKMRQSREEWMRIAFRQQEAAVKGKVAAERLSLSESIACGFAFDLGRCLEDESFFEDRGGLVILVDEVEKAVAP